jgi:hypothetical protein
MRFGLIFRIMGALIFFLGLMMIFPLFFSLYYRDGDFWALVLSAAITTVTGAALFLLFRGNTQEISHREGFAIVSLGWASAAFFGSLPYMLAGVLPSFVEAYFESTSGFTTTGATVLAVIEGMPRGILFWRSLTHWLGGMGIIVLSIAILPFLGVGGMQLFRAEVPGPVADKLKPRIAETAKILWQVYMLISAAETLLLMAGGMNLFEALCHTFGTMATGGFSTRNISIGFYDRAYFDGIITGFMILAGTNFALHYQALTGDFRSFYRNSEVRFYWVTLAGAMFLNGRLREVALLCAVHAGTSHVYRGLGWIHRGRHEVREDSSPFETGTQRTITPHSSPRCHPGPARGKSRLRRGHSVNFGVFLSLHAGFCPGLSYHGFAGPRYCHGICLGGSDDQQYRAWTGSGWPHGQLYVDSHNRKVGPHLLHAHRKARTLYGHHPVGPGILEAMTDELELAVGFGADPHGEVWSNDLTE